MKNDQQAIAAEQTQSEAYFCNISKLAIMKVTSWNLAICTSTDLGFKQQVQEMVIESLLRPLSNSEMNYLIGEESTETLN